MTFIRARGRRPATGVAAALALTAVLSILMLPARTHLGTSTSAMVLIIPVVAGVAIGGWFAGVVATAAGFFCYDFLFIRPYSTLAVSNYRDWVTLGVYVVVMLIVARVVFALQQARVQARRRAEDARHLLEVSDLLIGDKPLEELLGTVVRTVQREFRLSSVALLLPVAEQLEIAAHAGDPIPEEALRGGVLTGVSSTALARHGLSGIRTLPLATAERAIGVLLLTGPSLSPTDQQLLSTYANHAALAVERAQLREQALQSRVLREVDNWRRALLGSVAHDLRTPLASIKASLSDLADSTVPLSEGDRQELLVTAEDETDRLTRLVKNLLDMFRIEAGMRRLMAAPAPLIELVDEALEAMQGPLEARPVAVDVAASLQVRVDRALVVRVLVNLLENAARHTPDHTPVAVRARRREGWVELEVEDGGPGLSAERLATIFTPIPDSVDSAGSPSGVGLVICKAFIEANGGRISARSGPRGGLQLDVLLPAA
ncbi:MAG TPA: ATP-binding protein [Candidatus Dormibacteraeota bacterium]|nr:ATP-binding protein [Candidatus Dormibacteraeota bacterium]